MDLDGLTVVDEELQAFREQWREEVLSKTGTAGPSRTREPQTRVGSSNKERKEPPKATPVKLDATTIVAGSVSSAQLVPAAASAAENPAIEIYDNAVRFEREGNLSKALEFYQRAFRLDDTVDSKWRRLWQQGDLPSDTRDVAGDAEKDIDFSYQYFERESAPFSYDGTVPVANELLEAPLSFVPKRKNKSVPISIIPDEIILVLLKHVAWMDACALVNVGLVNKKLYMLTREQVVWRDLCERTYRPTVATISILEADLPSYNGDWKLVYLKRPRVRFDGLYISRCHYWRPGESEYGLSKPYIMVTYFRYLRFFRDGTAVSLCTTVEPIDAVKLLRELPKKVKSLMTGTWTLTNNKLDVVMADKDRPNAVFNMRLVMRSTGHSCSNSVKWERYSSIQPPFDEVVYDLNGSFKPFAFSRVRSYI